MEKIKLLDKGNIELPKNILEKFRFEKGMEFNLFFDSDTILEFSKNSSSQINNIGIKYALIMFILINQ